ncbi:MAG: isopentenyl phosphate kinase [Methanomicrobiales archaeon]|nr:isopentenyl phosphate kinase [Methanomicrobiales archaeon]
MDSAMILKLGGSVITDKSGECEIDGEALSAIARCIAGHRRGPLVVVHGAGSCGHPQAKRFHLQHGLDRGNVSGLYLTHRAVCSLNERVVEEMRGEGIEAVGIPPLAAALAENGAIASMECRPIATMLQHGIVPVLHGDVVMDTVRGAAIVSGDRLLAFLATMLGIKRVGLATDVEGVMDGGVVVKYITPGMVGRLRLGGSGFEDVTGGMKGKVQELLALASAGVDAHIFHVRRLGDFMDGREHGGTIVQSGGMMDDR